MDSHGMTEERNMAYEMTLYYSKRFDSGILKGITIHCSVPVIDHPDSIAWVVKTFRKGSKGRDVITKGRWTIVDASFQNYRR